jgi:hypothetical protein
MIGGERRDITLGTILYPLVATARGVDDVRSCTSSCLAEARRSIIAAWELQSTRFVTAETTVQSRRDGEIAETYLDR